MSQYIIAHKVRGQPALDIAERIRIGDEEGWIIPTSGHRAYPYWWEPVGHIRWLPDMPEDLPDHYRAVVSTPVSDFTLEDLDL